MDKAHILREIKRTAEANDGKPLGTARFAAETGIKRSDWFAIHWARWSEALCEAGYVPNQLIEAYDDDELLEHYAKLAAGLGRLPANSDIRLQTKKNSDFPHDATFSNRWSKAELVARLLEFCRNREEYQCLVPLCESYAPRVQQETQPQAGDDTTTMGYVYLIKMNGHKYYKIGMTNCVGRRAYELDLQLPEHTELVHVIATDDPAGIEAYWHNRFKDKNTNGEWFALDAADIAAFKRRKFM
jgi:hypothetical protein